ncbi:phage baseplate assembly protein V [Cupriavidus basilensis]|uniref:phage baseplate assembly protein V n=1 Tax=Cupriavidus basilensis TaxID=68895 RepID=UPI0039F69D60
MMVGDIDKRIRRAMAGIRQGFRAVLTLVSSDSAVMLAQGNGLAGEQLQDAELFQHYGMTSNPPEGTMAVVLPIGGKTSHGIIIATEHGSYRLKALKSGEVAIYTDEGDSVHLRRGRVIEVTTKVFRVIAEEKVEFVTPLVEASEKVIAQGLLSGNGGLAVKGGDGDVTAVIEGKLVADEVIGGGKSLAHHRHQETGGISEEPL